MENRSFSLEDIYDPESFRKTGHALVDMLADNLALNLNAKREKVIDFIDPDDNYQIWENEAEKDPVAIFKKIQENSIQVQHPRYMGHQVCVPAPITALAAFQGALLNSGGAIYEMSAATSALEKYVIDTLKPYFGMDQGDGFITSGGTLANLTALLCARNVMSQKLNVQQGSGKFAFMVSEEAHYCVERAVRIMGWGEEGLIKIPVDNHYVMKTDYLETEYHKAKERGVTVLGVVGSAPSTSTGKYDDLNAIGLFCRQYDLWFHVDAAHGGPAAFSEKYQPLTEGTHRADSLVVDAHKMMMTPSLTTMLFFARSDDSYRTFEQQAQYLWSGQQKEWYNFGKRTMECTKIMLSTRVYMLMQSYGMPVFAQNVERCYDLGREFAEMIRNENALELAVTPDSNIVCFRIKTGDDASSDLMNSAIRKKLLEDGTYYIVQTALKGRVYLRVSIMNPFTTRKDLEELLDVIRQAGKV